MVNIMKALTKIKVVLIIRLITPLQPPLPPTTSPSNHLSLQPPLTDLQKKTVFILRDSMVKKLNSFLLTREPNHNFFVRLDHLIRPR